MEVKIETDSNDAMEIKTEADSNDMFDSPHYDGKPSSGMFRVCICLLLVLRQKMMPRFKSLNQIRCHLVAILENVCHT